MATKQVLIDNQTFKDYINCACRVCPNISPLMRVQSTFLPWTSTFQISIICRAFNFNVNFYHHFRVFPIGKPTWLSKKPSPDWSPKSSSNSRHPADPSSRLRSGQSTHQIWLLCMFPVAATEPSFTLFHNRDEVGFLNRSGKQTDVRNE